MRGLWGADNIIIWILPELFYYWHTQTQTDEPRRSFLLGQPGNKMPHKHTHTHPRDKKELAKREHSPQYLNLYI